MKNGFWLRNKFWIILTAIVYAIGFSIALIWGLTWSVKFAAYSSVVFLFVVLVPIRISRWLPQESLFKKYLLLFVSNKRSFGISAAFAMILHIGMAFYYHGALRLDFYFERVVLPGAFAELVLIMMLITSGAYLTRVLGKYWKPLHRFIWFAIPLIFLHAKAANQFYSPKYDTYLVSNALLIVVMFTALLDLVIMFSKRQSLKVAIVSIVMMTIGFIVGQLLIRGVP